jgi:hypothetical protein
LSALSWAFSSLSLSARSEGENSVSFPGFASTTAKAAGAILIAGALGLGFISQSVMGPASVSSDWKGYRVLLVEKVRLELKVLAALRTAGITSVLSESNEPFLVSNWSSLDTMSLAQARETIAPDDPRCDAYLKRMGQWFEARVGGADYRVYYIKDDPSPFSTSEIDKSVVSALKGYEGKYLLPRSEGRGISREGAGAYFGFAVLVMLLAAAAGPFMGKTSTSMRALCKKRPGHLSADRFAFRLSLLAPWFVLASGGLAAAALSALWGIALSELAEKLDLPLDELRDRGRKAAFESLKRQGFPALVLPAVALFALLLAPGSAAAIGISLSGSCMAGIGFVLITAQRNAKRRFTPLPIGGSRFVFGGRSASGKTRAILAVSVVLAWVLCRIIVSVGISWAPEDVKSFVSPAFLAYPSPVEERGSAKPLPAEARTRANSETGALLPGLSSYLEHRAIQEALPYVRLGQERADPFASLSLPEGVDKSLDIRFDDDWAKKAYAALPALSIESMLVAQGEATLGESRPGLAGGARPLAPIECLLYIFLLIPPIGRLFAGVPSSRDAASGEIRQEA